MSNRISIGIPTFRRNEGLSKLLSALRNVDLPDGADVDVTVFDNDPDGGARETVSTQDSIFGRPVGYVFIGVPGLANVRNACLTHAMDRHELLVMLDDDEMPERQWLRELVKVAEATGSSAVVGPVQAVVPAETPDWLRAFRRQEYPESIDGARLAEGWSSNCLVRLADVQRLGVRFDVAMNFSGGEDQLFFRQLVARGGEIRYARQAIVWEDLPPARREFWGVVKRSFRRGGSLTACDWRAGGSATRMAVRAVKGLGTIVISVARMPLASLRGHRSGVVLLALEVARGLGMLVGLVGVQYRPYGRRSA